MHRLAYKFKPNLSKYEGEMLSLLPEESTNEGYGGSSTTSGWREVDNVEVIGDYSQIV
jgi:hypothetical protein